MKIADRQQFLTDNPHLYPTVSKINLGDPVSLGVTRPSDTWNNEILGKVKKAHPLGNIQTR